MFPNLKFVLPTPEDISEIPPEIKIYSYPYVDTTSCSREEFKCKVPSKYTDIAGGIYDKYHSLYSDKTIHLTDKLFHPDNSNFVFLLESTDEYALEVDLMGRITPTKPNMWYDIFCYRYAHRLVCTNPDKNIFLYYTDKGNWVQFSKHKLEKFIGKWCDKMKSTLVNTAYTDYRNRFWVYSKDSNKQRILNPEESKKVGYNVYKRESGPTPKQQNLPSKISNMTLSLECPQWDKWEDYNPNIISTPSYTVDFTNPELETLLKEYTSNYPDIFEIEQQLKLMEIENIQISKESGENVPYSSKYEELKITYQEYETGRREILNSHFFTFRPHLVGDMCIIRKLAYDPVENPTQEEYIFNLIADSLQSPTLAETWWLLLSSSLELGNRFKAISMNWGPLGNEAKTMWLNILLEVFGDTGYTLPNGVLQKESDATGPDATAYNSYKKHFVVMSELPMEKYISRLTRLLTGGNKKYVRTLFSGVMREQKMEASIWADGNTLPNLDRVTLADSFRWWIWHFKVQFLPKDRIEERLRVVDNPDLVKEIDPNFETNLRKDLGVVAMMLFKGFYELKYGLNYKLEKPKEMVKHINDIILDNDNVWNFIKDLLVEQEEWQFTPYPTTVQTAYSAFVKYCKKERTDRPIESKEIFMTSLEFFKVKVNRIKGSITSHGFNMYKAVSVFKIWKKDSYPISFLNEPLSEDNCPLKGSETRTNFSSEGGYAMKELLWQEFQNDAHDRYIMYGSSADKDIKAVSKMERFYRCALKYIELERQPTEVFKREVDLLKTINKTYIKGVEYQFWVKLMSLYNLETESQSVIIEDKISNSDETYKICTTCKKTHTGKYSTCWDCHKKKKSGPRNVIYTKTCENCGSIFESLSSTDVVCKVCGPWGELLSENEVNIQNKSGLDFISGCCVTCSTTENLASSKCCVKHFR